ncbi:MAG TPA: T9SS type A sorting domain-containing protein [Cytophagaceae bacterium]|nr:T9SS type A sorting domain-containing protein [Cytophagaceae bacterium]
MKKTTTTIFALLTMVFCMNHQSIAQTNLVVNGNFADAHVCPATSFSSDSDCDPTPTIDGPGHFAVTTNAATWNGPWYGTSRLIDGTNFLINDGNAAPNTRVWIQSVNVESGKQYTYTAWVKNIVNPGSGAGIESPLPSVSLRVDGNVIVTSPDLTQTAVNNWTQITGTYTATSTGSVSLDVFENVTGFYNDVAIDDISFTASVSTGILNSDNTSASNIHLAPNPFVDETSLSVDSDQAEQLQADIYNANGLLLYTQLFFSTEKITLGKSLTNGLYFIKISQNGTSKMIKALKQ